MAPIGSWRWEVWSTIPLWLVSRLLNCLDRDRPRGGRLAAPTGARVCVVLLVMRLSVVIVG